MTANDFIAALSPSLTANWEICKREGIWGIVGRGANWRKNAKTLQAGDRVFVWRGGRPTNGFIAEVRTLAGAEFVGPSTRVPWPNPDSFGAVFPIEVCAEASVPLKDSFPDANGRVGLRYGFNNMVLQHVFEEIGPEVADRIARDFDPFRSRP